MERRQGKFPLRNDAPSLYAGHREIDSKSPEERVRGDPEEIDLGQEFFARTRETDVKRSSGIEGKRVIRILHTESRIGTIPMVIWKVIEILLNLSGLKHSRTKRLGPLKEFGRSTLPLFPSNPRFLGEHRTRMLRFLFERWAGFRNIVQLCTLSPPGSTPSFLPHGVY